MKYLLPIAYAFLILCACSNSKKTETLNPVDTVKFIVEPEPQEELQVFSHEKLPEKLSQKPNTIAAKKITYSKSIDDIPCVFDESEEIDIYTHFSKNPTINTVSNNKNVEVVLPEGTKIFIPANAFVYAESGEAVKGDVSLHITEYYKMEDILFTKLSTNTNNHMLETGGMLFIEASSDGKKCNIAEGKHIAIEFKANDPSKNMQVFDGLSDSAENIIWELQKNEVQQTLLRNQRNDFYFGDPTNTLYKTVEKMPEFADGNQMMIQWINEKLIYPEDALNAGVSGDVVVSFIVTDSGTIRNTTIERGIGFGCDEAVKSIIDSMPLWNPGLENDIAVDVRVEFHVHFVFDATEFTIGVQGQRNTTKKDKKFRNNDELWLNGAIYKEPRIVIPIKPTEVRRDTFDINSKDYAITNALLFTSNLGWINCDRFIGIDEPKSDYTVQINEEENVDLTIVFQNYNAAIRGFKKNKNFTFYRVLIDEPITIFGIKNVDGQFYYCKKETVTSKYKETELEFFPATHDELKQVAASLNRQEVL